MVQLKDSFLYEGSSSFGVLLLHGFTADPRQMSELAGLLHEAGYTVRAPLLPGHGGGAEALRGVTWRGWLQFVREEYTALKRRCGRVAVAGISMGGALAALLAEEYPVDALVLYSPCVRMKQKSACIARIAGLIDLYRLDEAGRRVYPLSKGYDLWRLAQRAMHNAFAVTAPALVFQSARDDAVDMRGAKLFCGGVSSEEKEYILLENSPHVCTDGPEKQAVFEKTLEFLSAVRDKIPE